jgi:hypothetical protein
VITYSQSTKHHELGLNFGGLTNLGLRYRTGSESALFRFTVLSGLGQNDKSPADNIKSVSSSFGFNLGFEKRKLISDKTGFYFGADLLFSYNAYKRTYLTTVSNRTTLSPGVGLVLGCFYKINDRLDLTAEVVPAIRYSKANDKTTSNNIETNNYTNTSFQYGLMYNSYNLTLSYKFHK